MVAMVSVCEDQQAISVSVLEDYQSGCVFEKTGNIDVCLRRLPISMCLCEDWQQKHLYDILYSYVCLKNVYDLFLLVNSLHIITLSQKFPLQLGIEIVLHIEFPQIWPRGLRLQVTFICRFSEGLEFHMTWVQVAENYGVCLACGESWNSAEPRLADRLIEPSS